jgi:hypothetical protein
MNKIHTNYIIDFILLALAVIPAAYSLYVDINDSNEYWFQRSGSLMVLFAVFLELNLLKYSEVEESGTFFIEDKPALKSRPLPFIKRVMRVVAFLLAALGTFIWGYGDLPFKA